MTARTIQCMVVHDRFHPQGITGTDGHVLSDLQCMYLTLAWHGCVSVVRSCGHCNDQVHNLKYRPLNKYLIFA